MQKRKAGNDMSVLFCNITWMKYYKGKTERDFPKYGGKYVTETGEANEDMNFYPRDISELTIDTIDSGQCYCFGFYETKTTSGDMQNQTHVEKIEGCSAYKKEAEIEHILVIWCAKSENNKTRVVGWYKNATVNRRYQETDLEYPSGDIEDLYYNIIAKAEDCILLPEKERYDSTWDVPRAKQDGIGFGQANVWYPTAPRDQEYVKKLLKNIDNYNGENWVYEYPEE